MLEAVHPVFVYQGAHFLPHAIVPPSDRHMEGKVGGGFFRPALPGLESFQQRLARLWDDKIDDRSGAACEGCSRAGIEIFAGYGAHEGQLHVGMRVNPAGHHQLVAGIDDVTAFREI